MAILIIDDSDKSQLLIEFFLKSEGYNDIITFKSAINALEYLNNNIKDDDNSMADLILMDVYMSDMDGITATKKIKENPLLQSIPILMVTVEDDLKCMEDAYNAGAIDYIAKPLKKIELKCRVRSAIQLKREMDKRKDREKKLIEEIKKREKLEDELIKAKKLESIGVLVGGIAHDYNNIMMSIMGNIDLAKQFVSSETKTFNFLEKAEDSVLRAKELTSRLITFSKGGSPVKKLIYFPDLLESTVKSVLESFDFHYSISYQPNLLTAKIDECQISQVIKNILINAVESMHVKNKKIISVHVENKVVGTDNDFNLAEGKYLLLSIEDRGAGILKENFDKVYDPYFSTKVKGQQKGMGLGLSICHSIIKQHKGHIYFTSKKDIGTTFYIYLPTA